MNKEAIDRMIEKFEQEKMTIEGCIESLKSERFKLELKALEGVI